MIGALIFLDRNRDKAGNHVLMPFRFVSSTSKQVVLTPDGQTLLGYAREIQR